MVLTHAVAQTKATAGSPRGGRVRVRSRIRPTGQDTRFVDIYSTRPSYRIEDTNPRMTQCRAGAFVNFSLRLRDLGLFIIDATHQIPYDLHWLIG